MTESLCSLFWPASKAVIAARGHFSALGIYGQLRRLINRLDKQRMVSAVCGCARVDEGLQG